MLRLKPSFPFFIAVVITASTIFPAFSRPFDQQYNRLGAPFAVFYNPSLIGNNPGHTLGLDMMSDSAGYNLRGALTVPVGKIIRREDLVGSAAGERWGYAGPSYRSSETAVSVGGIYAGPEDYQLSAGFAVPVYFIQSGVSFDLVYRDDHTTGALNLAFAASMPKSMKNHQLYIGLNNLVVNERDGTNNLNASIGAAGTLTPGGLLSYTPYDLSFTCHMKDDRAVLMEGTALVGLDLTARRTSRARPGQLPAAALGYTLIRQQGGAAYNHKIFANFGITFVNRSSSAGILGSYGQSGEGGAEEKGAAFFYSWLDRGGVTVADIGLSAELMYREIEDEKYLFALNSAGTTIRSWVLRIENPRGGSVKTFSGGSAVPSSVLWDGLGGDGSKVEEEYVTVKLVVVGESKVAESNVIQIPLVEFFGENLEKDAARMLRRLPPHQSPLKMPPK